MSHYRTIRMAVAGAALALAGCAATAPEREGRSATEDTATRAPTESGSMSKPGAHTVVEATGIAYLGENTTSSQAQEHAYIESRRRLFDAGATIHLSSVQTTTFGELTTDCAMQVVGGTLLDFEVIEEGFDGPRYFVKSRARFEKREAEKALGKDALKEIGCWSGEDEPTGGVAETRDPGATRVTTTEGSAPVKSDGRTSSGSATSFPTSGAGSQVAETPIPEPIVEKKDVEKKDKETVVIAPVPAAATTVCCHEFPDTLSRKLFPLLEQTQGVTRLRRLTTDDGLLCYEFHYDGPLEPLEERLKTGIRTSSVLAFKVRRGRGPRIIDLVFDGGFDD